MPSPAGSGRRPPPPHFLDVVDAEPVGFKDLLGETDVLVVTSWLSARSVMGLLSAMSFRRSRYRTARRSLLTSPSAGLRLVDLVTPEYSPQASFVSSGSLLSAMAAFS